jgi:Lipid A 3-O-deacylase (PagL)/OmpA-like transmembrane domain
LCTLWFYFFSPQRTQGLSQRSQGDGFYIRKFDISGQSFNTFETVITKQFLKISFGVFIILIQGFDACAQKDRDERAQYPAILSNSFTGVNIGYINYPFSGKQLETGYNAASIHIPHAAVRIILFGHQFNKYLSGQITYMRPVDWVEYKNINGDQSDHSVWMNVVGLTVKAQTPVWKKFSIYGEAGLAIITRRGFYINDLPVVKDADHAGILSGAGLQYRLNTKWDIILSAAYSPANSKSRQPHTIFYSAGFNYNMRPLPAERAIRNSTTGFIFPKNLLQVGYTTNGLGYGVNDFVSKEAIPIFWAGDAQIGRGISLQFQHNIFHTRKVFSLDWGADISYWQSRQYKNKFYTVSLFPLLRFTAFRSKATDIYFNYSVAGPTFISKTLIDGFDTGKYFTFQDFMGMGIYTGKNKNMNAEIRIMHYSNGNIFPRNTGLMIPLTFNVGYAF